MVLWASLIFAFSTDSFSSERTQNVVVGILHTLLPHAPERTLYTLHDFLRKCAHLGEYFVFGVLLFRSVRAPGRGWHWRWALLAILIAAFYASSDEIHQVFVPSRGASVWDALLDAAGASVAQLAVWFVNRREQSSGDQQFGARLW